jgi:tetrahydromethanopterin S-methyltransferase subunit A
MKHPKFILQYESYTSNPFVIMEYTEIDGHIAGRTFTSFRTFEAAIKAMSELSGAKGIVLAYSNVEVDNVFTI